MLMSRASRMAVEVLIELTEQAAGEWMSAAALCLRIDSGIPFLKQVLNRLARVGLVRARPGRKGGYQLARSSQTLSLSAVARAMDGRDVRQQCLFDSASCDGTKSCRLAPTWHSVRDSLISFLETESIKSVADRQRTLVETHKWSEINEGTG